jgi:LysM repeat protein
VKKIVNIHIFALILISIPVLTFSQNDTIPEIKRSDNKVIIGGQKYYIHEVEKGETLYSISKAYNVPQKIIARENPDVFLGLRPGQALKIPFRPEEDKSQTTEKDSSRFFFHRVKKGQTLYSLSRRYQTNIDTIKKYNPILSEEELKSNQVIKIPRKTTKKGIPKTQKDTIRKKKTAERKGEYTYHRVRPDETLYSISKQYNVGVNDIISANKGIDKDNLQFDRMLRIPMPKDTLKKQYAIERDSRDTIAKDTSIAQYTDITKTIFECDSTDDFKNQTMNVTLFLPLYTDKNFEKYYIDSSKVKENGEKKYKKIKRNPYYIYPPSKNFIEFYEGILLALDTLKKNGISVNLKVFDTKKDTNQVRRKIRNNNLSNEDLIIGPVYDDNFRIVSDYAKKHNINIVSPFPKEEQSISTNPNLIQIYPTRSTQLERYASYISRFNDKNMVLVHTGDSLYYPRIRRFKQKIFSYISRDTSLSDIRFKEVAYRDSMFYLQQALNKGEQNIVIVPSQKEAFVSDVITNLNTLTKKDYNIRVFGYSQWKDFVNVNPEYFYNLNVSLFTPFHVNYKKPIVKRNIRKYRKQFKTEPSEYVFHGFDIGYYFFNALYKYGENFKNCLHQYHPELCHSNFLFYRENAALGIENISIYVLEYKADYTIEDFKLTIETPKYPQKSNNEDKKISIHENQEME